MAMQENIGLYARKATLRMLSTKCVYKSFIYLIYMYKDEQNQIIYI